MNGKCVDKTDEDKSNKERLQVTPEVERKTEAKWASKQTR